MAIIAKKESPKCKYCLEPVNAGAIRCKHCQADLTSGGKKKSRFAKYDNFRFGFLFGVIFTVALGVVAYFHFYRN